jgi:hypothetical protein
MKPTPFLLLLMLPACLAAQEAEKPLKLKNNPNLGYKYAVKISNITTITQNEVLYSDSIYHREGSYTNYAHAAPAIQVSTRKNNFHEIELTDFTISRKEDLRSVQGINWVTSGESSKITSIALRYEYILNFSKRRSSRWVPALGFAASPYYLRFRIDPFTTNIYPTMDNFIGMRMFVIPRLSIHLNKRIFLDFNVPACLANIYYQSSSTATMLFPRKDSWANSFNVNVIPFYFSFRGGVGIKL